MQKILQYILRLPRSSGEGGAILRSAGSTLIVRVAAAFAGFGMHLVLARALDVSAYGSYSFLFSICTVLAFVCRLGFQNALVRIVSSLAREREWSRLRAAHHLAIGVSALAAVVVWIAITVQSEWGFLRGSVLTGGISHLIPIIVGALALIGVQEGFLRGLKRPALSLSGDGLARPLATTIIAFVILETGFRFALPGALLCTAVGACVALLWVTVLCIRATPPEARGVSLDLSEARTWFGLGLTLLFSGMVAIVNSRADSIMLGILVSHDEVALYAVASRFAVLLLVPLQAVNAVVAPIIAESYAAGERERIQRAVTMASILIAVATMPAAALYLGFGDGLLSIFGEQYRASYPVLAWLTIGQAINSLCGSVMYLMTMTQHHRAAASVAAASATVNVALNLALIPSLGAKGAAIATASSVALQNLLLLRLVRKNVGVDPTLFSLIGLLRSRSTKS